jgi:hypothetical protein
MFGQASFVVGPSARRLVAVRLTARAIRQLALQRRLTVRAIIRETGGASSVSFVTLRAAR